jgi:pimeloyl-ACP methyl ester carboxylesterase
MNRGPRDFGLRGETVSFRSSDGIGLKAWWLPADSKARANVVIAHGVDHTRQVMLPRAAFLVRNGYNVLVLDLRGHGESAARYTSPGYFEARDVLAGMHYVRSRDQGAPIVLLGLSYGAAAVFLAAAQSQDVAAIVADGIYPTGRDVFENINHGILRNSKMNLLLRGAALAGSLPGVPAAAALVYYARTGTWLGWDFVSVLQPAARIRVPVLFISGERDWVVPTDQVRQVMAIVPTDHKFLVTIPGAGHDTTFSAAPALYTDSVLAFLANQLPN